MNRLVVRVLLAASFLIAVPSVAAAQAKKGDTEILLFGNLFTIHGGGSTSSSGMIFVNFGKFTSDVLEIGGGPIVTISGGGGSTSATVGANMFVRRSFVRSNPKIAPYVGAEVQIQDFKPDTGNASDMMFIQGTAGVKNYISEKAAIDFKGLFGFAAKHPGDLQIFGFTVGLTVVF